MAKSNPYLQDKKWLYQQYIIEQKSSVDISKLINVKASSVLGALKRNNIKTRSFSSAAKKRTGKRKLKIEKLNNKQWLFQKYIEEKLTTYQIADLVKSNQKSVMTALKRHNISARSISEAAKNREHKSKYKELEDKEWLCKA